MPATNPTSEPTPSRHRMRPWLVLLAAAIVVAAGVSVWFLGRPWIRQGAYGRVILIEGDCMPTTTPFGCRQSGVSRTITIREPTPWTDTYPTPENLTTAIVAVSNSSFDGYFEISLPPGRYSAFVEDGGRPYCNAMTSDGNIACPLEVPVGLLHHDLQIDRATH